MRVHHIFLFLFLLVGCSRAAEPPEATLQMPTAVPPTLIVPPIGSAGSNTPLPPPPTMAIAPTSTPTATATQAALTYRVTFVTSDDTLNVRSGPGVSFDVVGQLLPEATGVQITGSGTVVQGSTWVPIAANGLRGWVNSRYLTTDIPQAQFCDDTAVTRLVAELQTAVANRDDALLGQLIHPERGIRIHTYWWNSAVFIRGTEAQRLFSSATSYYWGIEDGSGFDITGTFAQAILPDLERDLLPASEKGCLEILHGGTAGLVRLPDGYEQTPYISLYRPATDESGFDWGTWVLGIEWWNGRYYLSYLVHYQWEI